MKYEEIVKKIAPCGLDCSRCADYEEGEIKVLSSKLKSLLSGYKRVAQLREAIDPVYEGYDAFEAMMNHFAGASCGGCRSEYVKCPVQCQAKLCHKDKEVDFCFQCDEFPCQGEFGGAIKKRWLDNNKRMGEKGVEEYYIQESKKPRY